MTGVFDHHRVIPFEYPNGLPPTLQTSTVELRPLCDADAENVFAYASLEETCRDLSWRPHQTIEDSLAFIKWAMHCYDNGKPGPWGVCIDNTVIGTAAFLEIQGVHRYGTIGYVISPIHSGKGYASEAAAALIDYAFTDLGLNRVEAQIGANSPASAKVLARAGLVHEATLKDRFYIHGQYHDSLLYAVTAKQWHADKQGN